MGPFLSALETQHLSTEQRLVRQNIREICEDFDASYWRECDRTGEYPAAFVDTLGGEGWLGGPRPRTVRLAWNEYQQDYSHDGRDSRQRR